MTATEALLCAVIFAFGSVVKGLLGVGLPLFAVPLLSHLMPASQAMVMVMVPVLATNAWQAFQLGASLADLRRFVPLLAAMLASMAITVPLTLTLKLPEAGLRALIGAAVLIAVVLQSVSVRRPIPPEHERWWGAGVGAVGGIMGGVSALTGPVFIAYLMALRLPRDLFVRSISAIYLVSALVLYGLLAGTGRIGNSDVLASALAMVPVSLGLLLGQRLRRHVSEQRFRSLIQVFLVGVALSLAWHH